MQLKALKSHLFFFLVFFCFQENVSAQTVDDTKIGVAAQFLVLQPGFRLDVEKRIENSRNWLSLGVQYFSHSESSKSSTEDMSNEVTGYGFALQHKIYLGENYGNFYIAYEPVFQHFNIDFSELGWHTIQTDGLTYYKYGKFNGNQQINRTGIDVLVGNRILSNVDAKLKFGLDIYAGVSYKRSFVKDNMPGYRDYTKKAIQMAYTGFIPVGGLKFGVFL